MRVTVCELPHEPGALDAAWHALCAHTRQHRSDLLLLPEFAMVEPVWEGEIFDPARWIAAEECSAQWMQRLPELGAACVVGTRPVSDGSWRYNQGFCWSAADGVVPLRSKYFLPDDPGGRETRWFDRGHPDFPAFRAGALSFGLNICTEMWAVETYASYASTDVQMILSPRATALATTDKWLSAGVVGAVRSGAFSASSNRVDTTGVYGGVGWIVSPEGVVLARTSPAEPSVTVDVNLDDVVAARTAYPRYVFAESAL